MTNTLLPAPGSPQPAAVTLPSVALSWGKIVAVCASIVLSAGGLYYSLVVKIYGDLHEGVQRVEAKIDAVQSNIVSAAKDGGSLQVLLTEAPELRKNIQETHDAVLHHDFRFDALDKSLTTTNESLSEIKARMSTLEAAARRRGDLPR